MGTPAGAPPTAPQPQRNPLAGFADPRTQMLLGMGAGILSQPYTSTPQSALQPFGAGLQQGMNAFQNALILQQQMEEQEAEKREKEAEAKKKAEADASFMSLVSALPPQQQQVLTARYGIDPKGTMEAVQTLMMPPPKTVDNTVGSSMMDEALVALGLPVDQPLTEQERKRAQAYVERQRQLNNPIPPTAGSAFDKMAVDVAGKQFEKITNSADSARNQLGIYRQMRGLSDVIESGSSLQPALTAMEGIAKDFGIPFVPFDPNDSLAAKENFGALNFKLVQEQRKEVRDSQFSSKDMEIYQKAYPSLSVTKEGRDLMIELQSLDLEQILNDEERLYEIAQEYEAQGVSPGEAMFRATKELKKEQSARAKDRSSLFVDEDGNPTELGMRLAELSNKPTEELFGGRTAPTQPPREPGYTYGKSGNKTFRKDASGNIQEWRGGKWVDV